MRSNAMPVMDDLFEAGEGDTELSDEEKEGLKPAYIATRGELNEAEAMNIARAKIWLKRRKSREVLSREFLRHLHRKMFGDVWTWAGEFRQSNKNIGVSKEQVLPELKNLLDDVAYWIENGTYSPDEIAVRFHHRLVWIHPFVNGNGRHAREVTNILLAKLGVRPFTWGRSLPDFRKAYLDGLKDADGNKNYSALLALVRK